MGGVSLYGIPKENIIIFFTSQKFQQTCPWLRSNEITKAMKTEYWLESGSLPLPLEWKQGAEDVYWESNHVQGPLQESSVF